MPNVILYLAHPSQHFSHVNAAMYAEAKTIANLTCVDLYGEYPRFDIDPDREQQRLLDHDTIIFQFPLFWYSTPSILKEWQDVVLEQGFAYGEDGDKLAGKRLILALSAAGSQIAYSQGGHQNHELRSFLTPLQQTAALCQMDFLPPFVLYSALKAPNAGELAPHVAGYRRLIEGLQTGGYDGHETTPSDIWTASTLPTLAEG